MRTSIAAISTLALALAACGSSAATAPRPAPAPQLAATAAPAVSPETRAEIDLLIIGLFAEAPYTRAISAGKLAAYGPRARPAMSYLLDCLVGDDDDTVAAACATAVGSIGAAALPALERIAEQCPDRTERVALALGGLGEAAAPLLARLPDLPRGCPMPVTETKA